MALLNRFISRQARGINQFLSHSHSVPTFRYGKSIDTQMESGDIPHRIGLRTASSLALSAYPPAYEAFLGRELLVSRYRRSHRKRPVPYDADHQTREQRLFQIPLSGDNCTLGPPQDRHRPGPTPRLVTFAQKHFPPQQGRLGRLPALLAYVSLSGVNGEIPRT